MRKHLVFLCLGVSNFSAFADLIDQNSAVSNDRLGELVKTVQGTYEAPKLDAKIRGEQAKVISNQYLANNYSGKAIRVTPVHPRIGMTKKQVLNDTTWGKPTSVGSTENRSGIYEVWVYYNVASLTFKNGILEVITRY